VFWAGLARRAVQRPPSASLSLSSLRRRTGNGQPDAGWYNPRDVGRGHLTGAILMEAAQSAGGKVEEQLFAFRKSLPMQVVLREVLRMAGDTSDLDCMDVGAPNCMISFHLRKNGGEWETVATGQDMASFDAVLEGHTHRIDGPKLPFENKTFDLVIVFGGVAGSRADMPLIEELHRCLKPDGRLILLVRRLNRWSLLRPLRTWLARLGGVDGGEGCSESDLFGVLKDGFDVHEVRMFGRFFMALAEMLTARALFKVGAVKDISGSRVRRAWAASGILYRLAFQLDMFLVFSRGHRLLVMSRRRAWRSRQAPVLVDGRSISEAVLSRAPR